MKPSIFMPNTIKVGYQERNGTYTGKLAYIIYYDEKGTLRKETSWNSWRDKKIEPEEFKNEPTSGFVLNKKAGGYSTGWNHRQTYVRVYDPRGFEFEIDVPNLLYILENTSSIKGKGLEGEFVYGWDGTELVLVPVNSPDYKEMQEYTKIIHSNRKFRIKDMIPGATYLTKQNEELIYIGRFDRYGYKGEKYKSKYYYFYQEGKYYNWEIITSLNKIIDVVSEKPVENYADLRDKVEHITDFSPIDPEKDEFVPYTLEELKHIFSKTAWLSCYDERDRKISVRYERPYRNMKYLSQEKKFIVKIRSYTYWDSDSDLGIFDTVEEFYEAIKPTYKNEYLVNGNYCRSDKRNVE